MVAGSDARTPTLAQVILKALDARMADLRVAMPAKVTSYDPSTQLANVTPLLQAPVIQEDGTETSEQVPDVYHVPVMTLGGGGYFISFPLQSGDTGMLVFADRSMDIWKSTGGNVNPIDLRQHNLSDAIFIPGIRAIPDAITDADPSLLMLGKSGQGADFVALASKVDTLLNALKTMFTNWVVVPNDGGGALKTLATAEFLLPRWPSNTGSASVKVKG